MPDYGKRISFFSDGTPFRLRDRSAVRDWLLRIAKSHNKKVATLTYIYVSDAVLLNMNRHFLDHDTFTDVITFPGDKNTEGITGEIYISIERVRDNAKQYGQTITDELARVMAHGLLHLCGFKDKSPRDVKVMRSQEEKALDLRTIKKR